MRAIAACLAMLVAAGCGPLPSPGPVVGNQPLQAYLLPYEVSGNLGFHVNMPAHVAIFRITPGQGTRMIYPSPGYGSMARGVFAGLHTLPLDHFSDREQYIPSFAANPWMGPEFYFMIASQEPLRTDQFGTYGYGLRSALGTEFHSLSAYSTMEQLASLLVPSPVSDNWTTDFYVHWPEALHSTPRTGLVQVQCGGNVFYVPPQYLATAYRQLCPQGAPDSQDPPQPGPGVDPPPVVEPTRRPPVEVTERIASNQLRDGEAWEGVRDAAEAGRVGEVQRRIARIAEESGRGAIDRGRERPGISSTRGGAALDPRPGAGRSGSAREQARPARDRPTPTPSSRPASRPAAAPSNEPSRQPAPASTKGGSDGSESSGGRERPMLDPR